MRNKSDMWSVKVLDDLDDQALQGVADFFNLYFPGAFYPRCSPEIFKWKLGPSNPAGRGFLTVAMNEENVIGTTSGTRRTILVGDSTIDAMEIGDTFTHPDFRRKGNCDSLYPGTTDSDEYVNKSIFGRLVTETLDRARSSGVKEVFGTPNENSQPPYISRLGFREIGLGKIGSWNHPTHNFTLNSTMRRAVPLLAFLLRLTQRVHLLARARKLRVEETTFDSMLSDIEALSLSTRETLESGSASLVQSLEFLTHRYALHPNYQYRYYEIKDHDQLMGWIICVFLIRQSSRETLVISDWITANETAKTSLPKYAAAVASKHREVQLVSLWTDGRLHSRFEWIRYGFVGFKTVSLITRDMKSSNGRGIQEFVDFRIGWSDNG